MDAELTVVIASVPWRKDNLLTLVNNLHCQSPEAYVHVLLDGYPDDDQVRVIETLDFPGVTVTDTCWARGQALRWQIPKKGLFLILDDDLAIESAFVSNTISQLIRTGAQLVCWTGFMHSGKHVRLESSPVTDVHINLFNACAVAGYAQDLVSWRASPDATPDKLARYMNLYDEALLSSYYQHIQAEIIRPSGPSLVSEIRPLSRDKRRLFSKAKSSWRPIREELGLCQHNKTTAVHYS